MHDPANEFGDAECAALMLALFPHGWASDDVLSEIAPGGYENSPLAAAFHPTVEQVYREAVAQHRHMRGLFNDRSPPEPRPEPTLEDIARDFHPRRSSRPVSWANWSACACGTSSPTNMR